MSNFGINQNYRMSGVARKQCRMNTVFAFDDMKNQKEIKAQYTKTSRPNFAPIKKENEEEKKHEENEDNGDEKDEEDDVYSYIQSISKSGVLASSSASTASSSSSSASTVSKKVVDPAQSHINKIQLNNIRQRCTQLSADHY